IARTPSLRAKTRRPVQRRRLACFFLQAEDGIRDATVTGVQTCALPIYFSSRGVPPQGVSGSSPAFNHDPDVVKETSACHTLYGRSEERRVGKECRSPCGRGDETENEEGGLREHKLARGCSWRHAMFHET